MPKLRKEEFFVWEELKGVVESPGVLVRLLLHLLDPWLVLVGFLDGFPQTLVGVRQLHRP